MYWYKKAVRAGSAMAASNIATMYRDWGDARRTFYWYKKSADMGNADALVNIGWRYYSGIGVRKDPRRGVECFRQAIRSDPNSEITEAGQEDAMYYLGQAYAEGQGVRRSLARARKWWERAAAGGHWEATARLKNG